MKISVTKSNSDKVVTDLLALPLSSGELENGAEEKLAAFGFDRQVLKDFKAEAGEVIVLYGLSLIHI